MSNNYAKIVRNNLDKFYQNLPADCAEALSAVREGDIFTFDAFGKICRITREGIILGDKKEEGVIGIIISLYALYAKPESCKIEPLKAFKDFQDSMPYTGAFATHTEQFLIPHVPEIRKNSEHIMEKLRGGNVPHGISGDFSFLVYPLPKIALCYIFYMADDEFPASVTALFSCNALTFIPIDALADVGEYTSKKIIEIISS